MENKRPGIDIINEVLEDCILAYPVSPFIISLYQQYNKRGSLSKKQLLGLHAKASTAGTVLPAKLATLQALINKMPNRFKSALPQNTPLFEKDQNIGALIELILSKLPEHKRVLFLKAKWLGNEPLTPNEITDIKKIADLVKKRHPEGQG